MKRNTNSIKLFKKVDIDIKRRGRGKGSETVL